MEIGMVKLCNIRIVLAFGVALGAGCGASPKRVVNDEVSAPIVVEDEEALDAETEPTSEPDALDANP